jgi:hydrophobic/amphiphilic exporter-1 (mainly G- bacteria), HAE1 family
VIGGLISSTILTLVVVPVMLVYIDRITNWSKRRFGGRSADEQAKAQHGDAHAKPAE